LKQAQPELFFVVQHCLPKEIKESLLLLYLFHSFPHLDLHSLKKNVGWHIHLSYNMHSPPSNSQHCFFGEQMPV